MDTETVSVEEARRPRTSTGFVLTSAFASGVGVVIAVVIYHLGLAVAGAIAGRAPVLYHNEVLFRAGGSDLALAGGAAASLIAGAIFLTLYPASRRYDAARLTVLWTVLHCFRQGFTPLAVLPFTDDSPLSRAWSTLGLPAGVEWVVSAAGTVGLLSVALASAPAFLAYASRQSLISTPSGRARFTAEIALVPGVVGPLLAVPVFLPDGGTGLVPSLPLFGAFTIATVLAALGTRMVRIGDHREALGWSWLPLAWLVFFALVSQFLFRRGVLIPPSLRAPFVDSM